MLHPQDLPGLPGFDVGNNGIEGLEAKARVPGGRGDEGSFRCSGLAPPGPAAAPREPQVLIWGSAPTGLLPTSCGDRRPGASSAGFCDSPAGRGRS